MSGSRVLGLWLAIIRTPPNFLPSLANLLRLSLATLGLVDYE
jgi:hypothetical protein